MELGKAHVVPFNKFTDVRYYHMKVVGDEADLHFSTAVLGMFIRKSDVLSIEKNIECWHN
jgi:hypothetical protein